MTSFLTLGRSVWLCWGGRGGICPVISLRNLACMLGQLRPGHGAAPGSSAAAFSRVWGQGYRQQGPSAYTRTWRLQLLGLVCRVGWHGLGFRVLGLGFRVHCSARSELGCPQTLCTAGAPGLSRMCCGMAAVRAAASQVGHFLCPRSAAPPETGVANVRACPCCDQQCPMTLNPQLEKPHWTSMPRLSHLQPCPSCQPLPSRLQASWHPSWPAHAGIVSAVVCGRTRRASQGKLELWRRREQWLSQEQTGTRYRQQEPQRPQSPGMMQLLRDLNLWRISNRKVVPAQVTRVPTSKGLP